MKKLILTALFIGCSLSGFSQIDINYESDSDSKAEFTRKVNDISYDIDVIIKTNKDKLKQELNQIDLQLENNSITKEEADKLRNEKAEFYASRIEEETKKQEDRIKKLINAKIEDNINFSTDMSLYQKKLVEKKVLGIVHYNLLGKSMLLSNEQVSKDAFSSSLLSNFGVGIGAKTRLGKDVVSPFYWKSTIDVDFNYFKLNNNKTFENIDNHVQLIDTPHQLDKSRMNLVDLRWSNYLEYDFSKHKYDDFGNRIVKSRQSLYVGLGGFIGFTQVTKQLQYTLNGDKYIETTSAKFNANRFSYGVGGYVGYKNTTIRATYNLNTVFKNAFADQNVFTVGIGFDLL